MRYVEFPAGSHGGASKVSVLGFGCSALMGRAGRRESLAALSAAMDAGVNFFDTARSYGYGQSESLLGEFLHVNRRETIISTKFGIMPAANMRFKQKLKPIARAVVRRIPAMRSLARTAAVGSFVPVQFSIEVLRESFHTSLRELRTDYVDILLLHAAPVSVLHQHDLLEAMERLVTEGKVRMAGISGGIDTMQATFSSRHPVLRTAQLPVNLSNLFFTQETKAAAKTGMFLVANHPFGGPGGVSVTSESVARLAQNADLPDDLKLKLTDDSIPKSQLMSEVLLNAILDHTGIASVMPSMVHLENLRRNVRAIEHCRFTSEEIACLRETLINAPVSHSD